MRTRWYFYIIMASSLLLIGCANPAGSTPETNLERRLEAGPSPYFEMDGKAMSAFEMVQAMPIERMRMAAANSNLLFTLREALADEEMAQLDQEKYELLSRAEYNSALDSDVPTIQAFDLRTNLPVDLFEALSHHSLDEIQAFSPSTKEAMLNSLSHDELSRLPFEVLQELRSGTNAH
jgi:hypothetical protein